MRYNEDVRNAESWNNGLKKSRLAANPKSDETAAHQNNTTSKTSVTPAKQSSLRKRPNRRKKREQFLWAGLLTGLLSRSKYHK